MADKIKKETIHAKGLDIGIYTYLKRIEFDTFKENAGSNAYVFSIKRWTAEL